ncbi:MAG TPA: glycosyltransferase family 39 protein, partial [Anaerolineae bacterium]
MRRNAILQRIMPHLTILLAFGLHLAYLVEIRQVFPDRFTVEPFCGVDAVAHVQRADGILDGTIPGQDTFYFIPFYPLYLAGLKWLVGDSLLMPLLIQALVQTVGLAALYSLGRLLFSPLTGLLAALGLATYSYYVYYGPCFDQALFTAPFLTLGLFFLVKYDRRRHDGSILGAGLALAIAVLSRPTTLAVLPVVVIWLFWFRQSLPQFRRTVVLLVLPVIIMISPITWHNYRASGRFVLLSDNFGVNLFTGNNPAASGLDSLAHAQSQPAVLHFLAVRARVIERHETTYAAEVLSYLREQPADALALTLRKTW